MSLSLRGAVAMASAEQPLAVSTKVQEDVVDYINGRLEQLLVDQGIPPEAGRFGGLQL